MVKLSVFVCSVLYSAKVLLQCCQLRNGENYVTIQSFKIVNAYNARSYTCFCRQVRIWNLVCRVRQMFLSLVRVVK
jgi:hypothetical protein